MEHNVCNMLPCDLICIKCSHWTYCVIVFWLRVLPQRLHHTVLYSSSSTGTYMPNMSRILRFISGDFWIIVRWHCTYSFLLPKIRHNLYIQLVTSSFLFTWYNTILFIVPISNITKNTASAVYLCKPKYIDRTYYRWFQHLLLYDYRTGQAAVA